MKMYKVCLFIPTIRQGGGAARVFLNLASEMAKRDVEVIIIVLGEDINEPVLPKGVTIVRLNVSRALFSVFKLRGLLDRLKPDFVVSTMGHLNLILVIVKPFVKCKPKFIARESNTVSLRIENQQFRLVLRFMYRHFYKNFDLIVAQANLMADDLVKNIGDPRRFLHVIGNPVNFTQNHQLSKEPLAVVPKKAKFRVVTVGRHVAQKRFDLAIRLLHELGEDYELLILGDGPFKDDHLELATRKMLEDRVIFVSFHLNPFPILATGDYYLITSEFEGLPNSALEALGLGLPVFGFNTTGGLPDYINSKNGCLVDFGDISGLATTIKQTNLSKGIEVSKTIRESLSSESICEKYLYALTMLERGEVDFDNS